MPSNDIFDNGSIESSLEYCPECGDFYPADEFGELQCDCEHDPYSDDSGKPLQFN